VTTFYLLRHAEHDLLGRELVGRRPGVHLNAAGRAQAARLAATLADAAFDEILSSPLERARETAEPIAARQSRPVTVAPALDEVDFGEWTGRSFLELDGDPRWRRFNRLRGLALIPGGELAHEVQARLLRLMEERRLRHPDGRVLLVSHGDVIRAALMQALAIPPDFVHRLEITPAALSTIVFDDGGVRVLAINMRIDGRSEAPIAR
jgi:broad specificity phosphatase PhoE